MSRLRQAMDENEVETFQIPDLNAQARPWTRIHRSGYPKFDAYHEMDLRSFPKHTIEQNMDEENLDIDPNRTMHGPSLLAATEYETDDDTEGEMLEGRNRNGEHQRNQSIGLNI